MSSRLCEKGRQTAPNWYTIWHTVLVHRIAQPNSLPSLDLYWAAEDASLRLPPCEDGRKAKILGE
jgi:hypothetical protein